MVKLNIKNGTPVGSEHLCRRCTWGQFMTGYRESEVLVICRFAEPNFAVPFVMMNCTEFSDRQRPTWEQMTKLAIHVAPPRVSKCTPGFAAVGNVQPIRPEDDEDETEDEDADEVARIR